MWNVCTRGTLWCSSCLYITKAQANFLVVSLDKGDRTSQQGPQETLGAGAPGARHDVAPRRHPWGGLLALPHRCTSGAQQHQHPAPGGRKQNHGDSGWSQGQEQRWCWQRSPQVCTHGERWRASPPEASPHWCSLQGLYTPISPLTIVPPHREEYSQVFSIIM